jgi:DNA-binding XRE family transcriptional regulator/outer membrane murein-binding lipoprotein Lpp
MAEDTKMSMGRTLGTVAVGSPNYLPWNLQGGETTVQNPDKEKKIADLEERMQALQERVDALEQKMTDLQQEPEPAEAEAEPQMTATLFSRKKAAVLPEIREKLRNGENPLRVYREHRGLTGKQLAEAAGVSQAYISQLETDRRAGTTEVMKKIAEALDVSLDRLV